MLRRSNQLQWLLARRLRSKAGTPTLYQRQTHPELVASPVLRAMQFQTTTDLLIAANPELAAGGPLAPGTQVKLPPV